MKDTEYIKKLNVIHELFKDKSDEEIEEQLKVYTDIYISRVKSINNEESN